MSYSELLKSPEWQKKRLEILERDSFACQECGDEKNTLHVHHEYYVKDKNPWDYHDSALTTLCDECHDEKHNISATYINIGKVKYIINSIDKLKKGIIEKYCNNIEKINDCFLDIERYKNKLLLIISKDMNYIISDDYDELDIMLDCIKNRMIYSSYEKIREYSKIKGFISVRDYIELKG